MKQLIPTLAIMLLLSSCGLSQDRQKGQQAVTDHMTTKHTDYKPYSFGEFFEQTYPEDIQKEIRTKGQVKYSIVHTYTLVDKKIIDEYFHLDKDYKVLGQLSDEHMLKMTSEMAIEGLENIGSFDSLKTEKKELTDKQREWEILLLTGAMESHRKNYEKAAEHFTHAIQLNLTIGSQYFYRGQCYQKLKKKDLACKDFNKAKELGFTDTELDEGLKKCKK